MVVYLSKVPQMLNCLLRYLRCWTACRGQMLYCFSRYLRCVYCLSRYLISGMARQGTSGVGLLIYTSEVGLFFEVPQLLDCLSRYLRSGMAHQGTSDAELLIEVPQMLDCFPVTPRSIVSFRSGFDGFQGPRHLICSVQLRVHFKDQFDQFIAVRSLREYIYQILPEGLVGSGDVEVLVDPRQGDRVS